MEVSLEYKCVARCHASDVWQTFQQIEDWARWSGVFGNAGWVHGQPWENGSRFFVELLQPKRVDLEVIVQKCDPPSHISLLAHGAGMAVQKLVSFREDDDDSTTLHAHQTFVGGGADSELLRTGFFEFYQRFFEELALQGEKHCLEIAL